MVNLNSRDATIGLVAGVLLLFVAVTSALFIGSADIPASNILSFLINPLSNEHSEIEQTILFQLRAPRIILGALVGCALASSGAGYQGVFRNDLADPYLLGVSAGAGLGVTALFISVANPTKALLVFIAFISAAVTVVAVATVAKLSRSGAAGLLLSGIAFSAIATSMQVLLISRNRDSADEVFFWILGGLVTSGWNEVILLSLVVLPASFLLIKLSPKLDLLRVGEPEAQSIGLNVASYRRSVVIISTLLTASAVSFAGLIGFVGLVVPHLMRLLFGYSYRYLVLLSTIWGAVFLVAADSISRVIASNPIPVGVITTAIGGPFFIFILILSSRKRLEA